MAINYGDFNFDSIWSGSAHDALTSKLNIAISNYNEQVNNYNSIMDANSMLDSYKNKKAAYESLNSQLAGLNWEEDADEISSIESEMASLKNEMNSLKSQINSIAGSISTVSSIFSVISYCYNDSYSNYLDNVIDFANFYSQGDLTKLSDGTSIYDYYNKEEVDNYLEQVRQNSKPGEENVNCAKAMMQLASQVNKELNIDLDVITTEVVYKVGESTETRKVSFSQSLNSVLGSNPYAYWYENQDDLSESDAIKYRTLYNIANKNESNEEENK